MSKDIKSAFIETTLCCDGSTITRGKVDKGSKERMRGTDSWEDGPSEDAEPLERPEEALEMVETVDMRRRVEDMM